MASTNPTPPDNKDKNSLASSPASGGPSCFTDTHGVVTSTMNDVPGYRIVRVLGTVYGLTVRARNWGAALGAVLKSAAGGELQPFTRLMYSTRNEAVERLIGEAMGRGANAVVALRFDASSVGDFAQVCAYGTACIIEEIR